MGRFLLILIPILTFVVPPRWFSYYAVLMGTIAVCQVLLLVLLNEQMHETYASFGIAAMMGYIGINLALLAVRYALIRRARARILKLPAPKE